jgi:hypothetical protein
MRTENHASPTKGISKIKSQGSAAAASKTLRIQTRFRAEKRLSTKPFPVNHGRLNIGRVSPALWPKPVFSGAQTGAKSLHPRSPIKMSPLRTGPCLIVFGPLSY